MATVINVLKFFFFKLAKIYDDVRTRKVSTRNIEMSKGVTKAKSYLASSTHLPLHSFIFLPVISNKRFAKLTLASGSLLGNKTAGNCKLCPS